MKILRADFVKSCTGPEQFPHDRLPEVACAGRSNVGKSSLINSLVNRKGLAKVSSTPGKTQLLNVFRIETSDPTMRNFYLVDLPGYGYAKVPRPVREQWGPMIERYLTSSRGLRGVLLLVDARGVQPLDRDAVEWLGPSVPHLVLIATKIDKLGRAERAKSLAVVRENLQVPESIPLIPYSSVTREGADEVWKAIREMIRSSP